MTPSEISCAHCARQPNEICVNDDRTPFVVDGEAAFHAERIEAAAAESQGNVSNADFLRALEGFASREL